MHVWEPPSGNEASNPAIYASIHIPWSGVTCGDGRLTHKAAMNYGRLTHEAAKLMDDLRTKQRTNLCVWEANPGHADQHGMVW